MKAFPTWRLEILPSIQGIGWQPVWVLEFAEDLLRGCSGQTWPKGQEMDHVRDFSKVSG